MSAVIEKLEDVNSERIMRKASVTVMAACVGLPWLGEAHARRYIDNGDGTISDTTTGLMWEKKTPAGDGGVHDVNNRYRWSDSEERPDGIAFTEFLIALNDAKSNDGETVTGCFANHCDWRLPQIDELKGIFLSPFSCSTSPCIDSIFGPTQSLYSWSATTTSALRATRGRWTSIAV